MIVTNGVRALLNDIEKTDWKELFLLLIPINSVKPFVPLSMMFNYNN